MEGGACSRDGTSLTAITERSLLGTEVGNYVLVQLLGEGGMGSVYRAVHPAIGAEVAIKVLHATSEAQAQRFLLEAQAVNRVRHAGLIKILDTGYLADRRPYLVMELLDGVSLGAAVGKLAPELACYVAAEALDALAVVHEQGIVHRDLKPPNVFLARSGRVVVLDFGIAKLVDGDGATQSTDLVGTPEYMAPEQIRAQPLDCRTDLYAMGVLLYETITGKRPFSAPITFDMLVQHLERPPTPPRSLQPALAPAIDTAILRALEKSPEDRFADAKTMATAVRAAGGSTASREQLIAFVQAHAAAPLPVPLERDAAKPDNEAPTKREKPERVEHTRPESQPRLAPAPRAFARRRWFALGAVMLATAAISVAIVVMRDQSAQRVAPAPDAMGVLDIGSSPAGADVTVDHEHRGVTPLTLELRAGAHLIRVDYAGRISADQAVDVRAGEHTSAMLVLPERPAVPVTATTPVTKPRDEKRVTGKRDVTPDATASTPKQDAGVVVEEKRAPDAGDILPRRKDNPFPSKASK